MFERVVNHVCCGVNHACLRLAALGKLTKFLRLFGVQGPLSFLAELMFLLSVALLCIVDVLYLNAS